MIIVSLSNVPNKLRGFLTEYLQEISIGVYIGNANAKIRNILQKRIVDNTNNISKAIMVFPADNEQGFDFYVLGSCQSPVDYDGLKLIVRPSYETKPEIESNQVLICAEKEYIVLDLETTGLDPDKDRIIEIGALHIKNGVEIDRMECIIQTIIPYEIELLTGINQNQANNGINIKEALVLLNNFINNNTIVGFNIRLFDLKFLRKEYLRNNIKSPFLNIVDILDVARKTFPNLRSYKLRDIAKVNNIQIENEMHRAIFDCTLCNEIYKLCITNS